jgi:hypothetical protein
MAGKGDRYRPVNRDKFDENWERIFGSRRKSAEVGGSSHRGRRKSLNSLKGYR